MRKLLFILLPFYCSAQTTADITAFGADKTGKLDCTAAIYAAINSLPAAKTTWSVPTTGQGTVIFPRGIYRIDSLIKITTTVTLQGDGSGGFPYQEVQLRFNGTGGFDIKADNHNSGARGVIIRNLYLRNFGGYDSTADGIRTNTRLVLDNVSVDAFGGNGFSFVTNDSGNANNSIMTNCTAYYCAKNGLFMSGNESNNFGIYSCNFSANGMCGVCDNSFLGNMYYNCHVSSNGLRAATGYSKSWCVYNGKVYQSIKYPNQKGIQPTVTTNWQQYWIENTTVFASTFPSPWNADSVYWYTGAYAVPSASATSLFTACYSEGGESANNMNQFSWCIGGDHGAIFASKDNIYINPSASQLLFHGAGLKVYNVDSTKTFVGFHNKFGFQMGSEKAGYSIYQFNPFEASRTAILYTDNSTGNQAFSIVGKGFNAATFGLTTLPRTGMLVFPYYAGFYIGDQSNGSRARNVSSTESTTTPPITNHGIGDIVLYQGSSDSTLILWRLLPPAPGHWKEMRSVN